MWEFQNDPKILKKSSITNLYFQEIQQIYELITFIGFLGKSNIFSHFFDYRKNSEARNKGDDFSMECFGNKLQFSIDTFREGIKPMNTEK